jgi:hypothetical protein
MNANAEAAVMSPNIVRRYAISDLIFMIDLRSRYLLVKKVVFSGKTILSEVQQDVRYWILDAG